MANLPMGGQPKPTTPVTGASPMTAQPVMPAQPIMAPQTSMTGNIMQQAMPQAASAATQGLMSLLLNKPKQGTTSVSTPSIISNTDDAAPLLPL